MDPGPCGLSTATRGNAVTDVVQTLRKSVTDILYVNVRVNKLELIQWLRKKERLTYSVWATFKHRGPGSTGHIQEVCGRYKAKSRNELKNFSVFCMRKTKNGHAISMGRT